MTPARLEPAASQSRVKHSTTEPLRSQIKVPRRLPDQAESIMDEKLWILIRWLHWKPPDLDLQLSKEGLRFEKHAY